MRKMAFVCLALVTVLFADTSWNSENGLILHGTIVTMTGREMVFEGKLYIKDGLIQAIVGENEPWPTGIDTANAIELFTGGTIFPGLINLHDHTAYNISSLWEVPQQYENRYQWTSHPSYATAVSNPKKLIGEKDYYDLLIESLKYAETKQLTGGVTATQGTPSRLGVKDMLIRNVELNNFGEDRVFQHVLPIGNADAPSLLQKDADDLIDAWLVHLAEGTDQKSRDEFTTMKEMNLLQPWTVIIHGTALGRGEFLEMSQVGAKLVWSPLSNMLLYGETTRVDWALAEGVKVSLATDWSPSGAKNLLGEIKAAWEINKQREANLAGYQPFDTYALAQMVTANPADTLGWDNKAGRLATGLAADILVLKQPQASSTPGIAETDPYGLLVRATERDVALVLVDGEPLYGDLALMQEAKGMDYEEVLSVGGGFSKGVDITRAGKTKGEQTLESITDTLTQAMLFNRTAMKEAFAISLTNNWNQEQFDSWFDTKFPDMQAQNLDPLFVTDDPRFFDILQATPHANLDFDLGGKYYPYMNGSASGNDPSDGSGSNGGPSPQSPEERALEMVNHPSTTFSFLDIDVGLTSTAASNIISHRDGPDAIAGTADDHLFANIEELDAVSYVGNVTLDTIITYAQSWTNPDGSSGGNIPPATPEELTLRLVNDPAITFEVLDLDAGLRSNAAQNIINYRMGPDGLAGTADDEWYDNLDELDAVAYVGPSTIDQLTAFALSFYAGH